MERLTKKQLLLKRVAIFAVCAVALAGLLKRMTEYVFLQRTSLAGAFETLHTEQGGAEVCLTGVLPVSPYGCLEKNVMLAFADKLDLAVDSEPRLVTYDGRRELVYERNGAEASSVIRVISSEEKGTVALVAEFVLRDCDSVTATEFKKRLSKVARSMELSDVCVTLSLFGYCEGELPLAAKDEVTDRMLSALCAHPVYENRENEHYTVYAYTGAGEEYIEVGGRKINVQTEIYYDKEEGKTEIVISSPISQR